MFILRPENILCCSWQLRKIKWNASSEINVFILANAISMSRCFISRYYFFRYNLIKYRKRRLQYEYKWIKSKCKKWGVFVCIWNICPKSFWFLLNEYVLVTKVENKWKQVNSVKKKAWTVCCGVYIHIIKALATQPFGMRL